MKKLLLAAILIIFMASVASAGIWLSKDQNIIGDRFGIWVTKKKATGAGIDYDGAWSVYTDAWSQYTTTWE